MTGGVGFTATAERTIAADDCSFGYAGYPGSRTNGTEIFNASGLVYFRNCRANGNFKDGFGIHGDDSAQLYALTYGCSAHANGAPGGVSINAHTIHENILSLDIAGDYSGGTYDGSVCHNINTSQCVFLGSRMEMLDSPDAIDAAVRTGSGSRSWLAGCTVISDNNAFYEDGGAQIEFQNCTVTGAVTGASANWLPQPQWTGPGFDLATLSFGVRFPHGPFPDASRTIMRLRGSQTSDRLDVRSVAGGAFTDMLVLAGGVSTSDTGPGVAFSTERLMAAARLKAQDFAVSFSGAAPLVKTLDVLETPVAMHLDYCALYDTPMSDTELRQESSRQLFQPDIAAVAVPDSTISLTHTALSLSVGTFYLTVPAQTFRFIGEGFLAKPADILRTYTPAERPGAAMPQP